MKAFAALLLFVLASCVTPPAPAGEEAALRRHIAYLASDDLAGRAPGTPGGLLAEAYIQRQFAAIGLLPGANGGGWYQPVAVPPKTGDPLAVAVQANNVIGRIAGSDGAGEAVVFLAHADHVGQCRPAGAVDRICNGAVDNASGVASLIEIARALACTRPRRDILFVATAAEELGLVGARAFAAAPPLPLSRIVAAINLDTVAVAPRGAPVTIVGRGRTGLDGLVDATARGLGRKVDSELEADRLVKRQDGWALLQQGVPAIMVGGAYGPPLERFFASRYHQPNDEADRGLELGGAVEDVALHVALGAAFADPARYPTSARQVFAQSLDSPAAPH
jgi:Zn-dependent M28 family amino/carboxypeptidase